MTTSFYNGINASKGFSTGVSMTSNNIANINTIGFKANQAEFSSLFSQAMGSASGGPISSDFGYGSRISGSAIDLENGSYSITGDVFDLALFGDGWFGVSTNNPTTPKDIAYTRDGSFSPNNNGYLTNQSGYYLLGVNHNNILDNGDGTFTIDRDAVPPAGSTDVATRTKLFAPKEITYPPTPTTKVELQKNLSSTSSINLKNADPSTEIKSLLSQDGGLIDPKNNEDMLLSIGTDQAKYNTATDRIEYSIALSNDTDANPNEANFALNGVPIKATWNEGAEGAEIAAAFKTAIDAAGLSGMATRVEENRIIFVAEEKMTISNSDYGLVPPVFIEQLRFYGAADDNSQTFSTLDDIAKETQNALDFVYGEGNTKVQFNAKGQMTIGAKNSTILFNMDSASNSNQLLLEQFKSLNRTIPQDTIANTLSFNVAQTNASQQIIDSEGNRRQIAVEFTQETPSVGGGSGVWNAKTTILQENTLSPTSDVGKLVTPNGSLDMKSGQNLWISNGTGNIQRTTFGYDYVIEIPGDVADGVDGVTSFNINGTPITVTFPDGANSLEATSVMAQAIKDAGFDASFNSNELRIHTTEESGYLSVTNLQSDNPVLMLPSHTLLYAEYDSPNAQNSFKSAEELVALYNKTTNATGSGFEVSIGSKGELIGTNKGNARTLFNLLEGNNSNVGFLQQIKLSNAVFDPNVSFSSNRLSAYTTIETQMNQVQFASSGQIESDGVFTIPNGTETLTLDFSRLTNYAEPRVEEFFLQNGEIAGELQKYTVETDGSIKANFDNNQSIIVGVVDVFHFQNDQGLVKLGDNLYQTSSNSGNAFLYADKDGNVFPGATVYNERLENSNVELQQAMSELIVFQRSFEGSSRVVSTSDEMLQTAINMKS